MMKSILASIPMSKRAYYVKKQTRLPSVDRNDPQILPEPWYWVMRRPVSPRGEQSDFYVKSDLILLSCQSTNKDKTNG